MEFASCGVGDSDIDSMMVWLGAVFSFYTICVHFRSFCFSDRKKAPKIILIYNIPTQKEFAAGKVKNNGLSNGRATGLHIRPLEGAFLNDVIPLEIEVEEEGGGGEEKRGGGGGGSWM